MAAGAGRSAGRSALRARPLTRASPRAVGVFLSVALAVSGCATRTDPDGAEELGAAATQPLADLNLIGDAPNRTLAAAKAAPYRLPASCDAARREVAALDTALGPTLSPSDDGGAEPSALAAEVIRSVARLPFRGVIRRLTGAEARDAARREALIAGVLRRGFLRGWTLAGCPSLGAPPPQPALPIP